MTFPGNGVQKRNRSLQEWILTTLCLYLSYRYLWKAIQGHLILPNDLEVVPHALSRWVSGDSPYHPEDPSPYKYSPLLLYLVLPLWRLMGTTGFWWIQVGTTLAAWLWSLRRWYRALICESEMSWGIFLLGLLAGYHGILEHQSYGQWDVYVFALYTWIWFGRRQWSSSLALALMVLVKPLSFLGLTVIPLKQPEGPQGEPQKRPYLVEMIFWAGLWLVLICFLASVFPGEGRATLTALLGQWRHALASQPESLFLGNINQSLYATVARRLNLGSAVQGSKLVYLAGFFGSLLVAWRTRRRAPILSSHPLMGLLGWNLFLLFNPLSWRWATFSWTPLVWCLMSPSGTYGHTKMAKILGIAVFVLTLLLQQNVAHLLGISEVDILSDYGLYTFTSILLCLNLILSLGMMSQERKTRSPEAAPGNLEPRTHRTS